MRNRKKLPFLATLLLALLCFYDQGFAQNYIQGTPVGLDHDPGGNLANTKTDANGKFSFKADAGNYLLKLSYADVAKRISIDLKDYAVHPGNYEISLQLEVVNSKTAIFDRWGNLVYDGMGGEKRLTKPVVITKETEAIKVVAKGETGILTGILTYSKTDNGNHRDSIEDDHKGQNKRAIVTTRSNTKHQGMTMIYIGAGYNLLNGTTKSDAFLNNAPGVNLSIYQPFVVRKVFTFGLQAGFDYAFSTKDNLPALPNAFHVVGETSSTVAFQNSAGGIRQSAYKFDLGPQLNIHAGDHFSIGAAFTAGAMVFTQPEFSAVQTTIRPTPTGSMTSTYTLLHKWDLTAGGLALTPKLRLNYLINDWIGLWAEVNYTFMPRIKSYLSKFTPQDTPDSTGYYDIFQLDHGTTTTEQRVTKYSAVGINGGLVFSFGKKEKKCPCDEANANDQLKHFAVPRMRVGGGDLQENNRDVDATGRPSATEKEYSLNRDVDAKGRPSSSTLTRDVDQTGRPSITESDKGVDIAQNTVKGPPVPTNDQEAGIVGHRDVDPKGRPSNQKKMPDIPEIPIHCTIARHGCSYDAGICHCRLGSGSIVDRKDDPRNRNMKLEVKGNIMFVRFKEALPLDATASDFVFEEPTAMEESIAKELGYKQIIIQKGSYKPQKEADGIVVKLDISAKKLTDKITNSREK
jgi:hypothetical protein